ncbi:pyrimidine-nucleoside phosphorylase [Candidatus Arthromitus sp. SFB-turkey]|uniref:pyrimidine-nucleoside phosphorylase n=1 Tax=Candidatus Arthromitus sp. SFB-turkey TaxID=1840217 RepID=UPI0007F41AB7|nr:pyrimidine-nucleoside phosphorylase [Candidatus Arthromitus sp. SFB-turkey]OAT88950.1 pyrimidine-nucleoside phosphorylase [Candidatus Arthromitus sp. SFB-turkey]HJD00697.1 pyrimidine-nucleoside phosphorylase [Candidatus Dwaynia gallinarum]
MNIIDIIDKKKNGLELSKEEITYFVNEYTRGSIPDYQASALIMAMFLNKMSDDETSNLTLAMAFSGKTLDLKDIDGIKVDKHSTGGVGDKISLIVTPIVASLGIPVAKMSGRGLGFTGGTIDKLESIEGFETSMAIDEFKERVKKYGMVIAGQTDALAPADKKIYALRDVTATVDNISLIASSIMSKKIASGADAIVLDIKVGSGAFMKTLDDAEKLATTMVNIGKKLNKTTICVLSNMDEPLGNGIGNIIEVREAIDVLRGNGPKDLIEVALTISSLMIYLGGKANSIEEAKKLALEKIEDGTAYEKFREWIVSQGGNLSIIDNINDYKNASNIDLFVAEEEGYISSIDTEEIGKIAMNLGAGRETKDSIIDPSVGLIFSKKVSDYVKVGDVICSIHHNNFKNMENIHERLKKNIKISTQYKTKNELIYKIIK